MAMKRSPIEEQSSSSTTSSGKRIKRSSSNSGIAAMTLLSLALSASSRKAESLTSRNPDQRENSEDGQSSVPYLISCDYEETDENKETPAFTTSRASSGSGIAGCKRLAPLATPYKLNGSISSTLRQDWRTAFKPLPMPPRLPRGLPAGAKAGIAH